NSRRELPAVLGARACRAADGAAQDGADAVLETLGAGRRAKGEDWRASAFAPFAIRLTPFAHFDMIPRHADFSSAERTRPRRGAEPSAPVRADDLYLRDLLFPAHRPDAAQAEEEPG